MKLGTKILIGLGVLAAANAAYVAYRIEKGKAKGHPGNADRYRPEQGTPDENSPLQGKKIIFLGSSVTEGAASFSHSFVEYLASWDGVLPVKEAVGGTLLVEQSVGKGKGSYITRMKTIDPDCKPDLFLCQLSTNDAAWKKPLGEISRDGHYDTQTVTGAIEYIIDYAQNIWNCPVVFYTGTRYDNTHYAAMVARLLELRDKWGISVIDLWSDEEMNAVTQEDYKLYMNDPVHPTMAGYSRWWLPKIRSGLIKALETE